MAAQIEKLELQIQHLKEIIQHKERENQLLNELLAKK